MALSAVKCSVCQTSFLKDNRYINESIKLRSKLYCSRQCLSTSKRTAVQMQCENPNCKVWFFRIKSGISKHNFCCHSCAAKYSNVRRGLHREIKYCKVCDVPIKRNKIYCSSHCSAKDHSLTRESLLAKLWTLAENLGRAPTRRECAQFSTAVRIFGSWTKALTEAGLTPHRSLNQRMYKRRECRSKDGHWCNSISELLIDNWLQESGIPHEKEFLYPIGKFRADWKIGEHTFIEYFGLANDSDQYNTVIEKKRQICRETGIDLIELYPKDIFPKCKLNRFLHSFQDLL